MRYYKFPKWLKWIYPGAIWDFFYPPGDQKSIYLTFDDGPEPESTNYILDLLKAHNALATFFCLGKNVEDHPQIFERLIKEGHSVGNHGYNHLNGWYTNQSNYLKNVDKAVEIIPSSLFRPPYGKIRPAQFKAIKKRGMKIIFWSHLTYDFDADLSSEKRIEKALNNVKPGTIIVFHDSKKAFPQLKQELPTLLKKWSEQGYNFNAIKMKD